jgi:hypothetical protein
MKYIKTINEIRTIYKSNIGHGRKNTAYNFIKDKGKVIKIGPDIKEHAMVFSKRSDIFPIVYKVTPNYIILEKLDTFDIREDFNEMFEIFQKAKNIELIYINSDWLSIMLSNPDYFKGTRYLSIIHRINYINTEILTLFKELSLDRTYFDLNPRNFGYDKNGLLKALDY